MAVLWRLGRTAAETLKERLRLLSVMGPVGTGSCRGRSPLALVAGKLHRDSARLLLDRVRQQYGS